MRIEVRQSGTGPPAVIVHTPAKLNLFLEILSRRPDGYHELETLMVAISIRDTLSLSSLPDGPIRLDCAWSSGLEARRRHSQLRPSPLGPSQLGRWNSHPRPDSAGTPWESLPAASDNLVVRALEHFRQRVGISQGAQISLRKRIPAAAGLGGASSDAAAALYAANRAWGLGWTNCRLAEFAAELGSDIPFFFGAGVAQCTGRGEKLEPLGDLPTLHFVVVRPPEGLSTAAVYRACSPAATRCSSRQLLKAWRVGDRGGMGRLLHNGLQEAALQLSPDISRLQSAFRRCHVLGHQMSGSGTSYFGLCQHARHARHVAGRLQSQGLGAVYCASTDRSLVSGTWQASGP